MKHLTDEHKKKISEALKGNHNTLGFHYIGHIPWNKGKHPSNETRRRISESHKGSIPWNKGIHTVSPSEETKRKGSESLRRRWADPEFRKYMSEQRKGIPKSDQWKKFMSERRRRLWLNREWRKRTVEAMKGKLKGKVPWMKGRHHTEEAKQRLRENHNGLFKGEKSPVWKGGITPERQALYAHRNWRAISRVIWRRDERTCQLCHETHVPFSKPFEIHHIIPFEHKEARLDLTNLILLCQDCHHLVHSKDFGLAGIM